MIPAYHWVPKSAFPEVLKNGYLTPAIERLSPGFFRDRCADDLDAILRDRDLHLNPTSIKALEHLVEDRIQDLSQWSRGDFSQSQFSQLGCIDFVAGDHESVFLQVGRWIDWGGSDKPTGFVFDSAALIREGATLREKDLAPLYWGALNKFLQNDWGDLDQAHDTLLEKLSEVQRAHQLRGKPAIKALSKFGRPGASELLWNGRLPIELAVESFNPDIYLEA